MYDILIIGGGLSGLVNARLLSQAGLSVALIEKNHYPFHRVCGEYVSHETLPFLRSIGFDPYDYGAVKISRFRLTSPKGTELTLPLDLGAFGLSRYVFDEALYQLAKKSGTRFFLGEKATGVERMGPDFVVKTAGSGELKAKVVIGAHGKRSNLDAALDRAFFRARSPWTGVKYHIEIEHPENLIELHNFKNGYCGISRVENGRTCLCYLTARSNVKQFGNIPDMEKAILRQNPFLEKIFAQAKFLYDRPQVINEISFERKPLVEQGILMSGDAGGMIAPLCGNGMAMAIHSAKLLSEELIRFFEGEQDRRMLEANYLRAWNQQFAARLWVGRNVQKLFGNKTITEGFVNLFKSSGGLSRWVVKQTHGKVF